MKRVLLGGLGMAVLLSLIMGLEMVRGATDAEAQPLGEATAAFASAEMVRQPPGFLVGLVALTVLGVGIAAVVATGVRRRPVSPDAG